MIKTLEIRGDYSTGWSDFMRMSIYGGSPDVSEIGTTWVNDLKVCHWNGETCPLPEYNKERVLGILGREGAIGLQVHGGKGTWRTGTQCRWRNILIQRL